MSITFLTAVFAVFMTTLSGCGDDLPDLKILSGPEVLITDNSEVIILWETNVPAHSEVEYGLTSALGADTLLTEERQLHEVPLNYLQADKTYFFRVKNSSDFYKGSTKSDINTFVTPEDYLISLSFDDHLNTGWSALNDWDLWNAHDHFFKALEIDKYSVQANSGIALAVLLIGDYPLDAYDYFNQAITIDGAFLDSYAGRAVYYTGSGQFDKALADARRILSADSLYVSDHFPEFIHFEMLLTVSAYSAYNLGNYEIVQALLDKLSPQNGLLENDPATWKVDNVPYDSYIEAQLALIEFLMTSQRLI